MEKDYCRFCHNELKHTFVDLGMTPLSNSYVPIQEDDRGEIGTLKSLGFKYITMDLIGDRTGNMNDILPEK